MVPLTRIVSIGERAIGWGRVEVIDIIDFVTRVLGQMDFQLGN